MNKKILSFGLSTLLIYQTALALPASVKAAEKTNNAQAQQLPKSTLEEQKNNPAESKNNKSNNTTNNILYLGGTAIPVAGVLYYLFGSKSRSSHRAPSPKTPNVPNPQSSRKPAPKHHSEPVPQAPRMPEPHHMHAVPPYLSHESTTDRMVLTDYENDPIACSTPIPIRNIAWWGHRCWYHSSILNYYHSNYHDAILNFPIEEARGLLNAGNLNTSQRSTLEAMISLAEIFIILNGDESNPDYRKPQVVFLNHERENDLLVKLKNFDTINGTTARIQQNFAPDFKTLNLELEPQDECTAVIKDLISVVHELMPEWQVPQGRPTGSQMRHNGAHFWVDYTYENVIFGIGRSTMPPEDSVADSRH